MNEPKTPTTAQMLKEWRKIRRRQRRANWATTVRPYRKNNHPKATLFGDLA
jgi:hypothetical protein